MNVIAYSRRNRFSLILFLVFSIVFIVSGISGVYKEAVFYGSGYFLSLEFLKTLLTFIPFILCTSYVFMLIRHKYVLVLNQEGILDQRYILGKVFLSWKKVFSAAIEKNGKNYYLCVRTKNDLEASYEVNTNPVKNTIKIPLKDIDYNLQEMADFVTKMTNK